MKYAKPGEEMYWLPLQHNLFYWTVSMGKIKMNGETLKTKSQYAILDTGMSLNLIPPGDFDAIKNYLEKNSKIKFKFY